jgi:hypothetical protein
MGFTQPSSDMAYQHIGDGNAKIARQRQLIEELRSDGRDTHDAERLLDNYLDVHQLFVAFRSRTLQALNGNRL